MSGSIANVLRRIESSTKPAIHLPHVDPAPPNKAALRSAAAARVVEQQHRRAEEVTTHDLTAALAAELTALRASSAPPLGRASFRPVRSVGARRVLSPVAPLPQGAGFFFEETEAAVAVSPWDQRPRSAESRLASALERPPSAEGRGRLSAVVAARHLQALWRGCAVRWFTHDFAVSKFAVTMLQRWWRRVCCGEDYGGGLASGDDDGEFGWAREDQCAVGSADFAREQPPPGASLDMGVWLGWLNQIESHESQQAQTETFRASLGT
jgi:hypothetical protein